MRLKELRCSSRSDSSQEPGHGDSFPSVSIRRKANTSSPSSLTNDLLAPVYTAELAPPALRGLFVGMNGLGIALGYALATYVGLGFYYSTNPSAQWRGSFGIALIFSALPLLAMLWVPESPRWLLMVNRVEDAKKVVRRLHNLANEDEHHFAMAEFYQMQKQIEYDRTVEPSWLKMFTRKSYRKRLIMTCTYSFLAQATGILGKCLLRSDWQRLTQHITSN